MTPTPYRNYFSVRITAEACEQIWGMWALLPPQGSQTLPTEVYSSSCIHLPSRDFPPPPKKKPCLMTWRPGFCGFSKTSFMGHRYCNQAISELKQVHIICINWQILGSSLCFGSSHIGLTIGCTLSCWPMPLVKIILTISVHSIWFELTQTAQLGGRPTLSSTLSSKV